MLALCRDISMSLQSEFLGKGHKLPVSLGDLDLLQEIVSRDPRYGELLNRMAVVPDAPVVMNAEGIRRDHVAMRIFAIERETNSDYAPHSEAGTPQVGRYSLWISQDGNYAAPAWILETEAQAIFNQLEGFDPSSQPLAFPDAERRAREKKRENLSEKSETEERYKKNLENRVRDKLKGIEIGSGARPATPTWLTWLGALIAFLAACMWFFRSSNNSGKR